VKDYYDAKTISIIKHHYYKDGEGEMSDDSLATACCSDHSLTPSHR